VVARAGAGHFRVPEEAADVVDDFGSGGDGGCGGRGFPGVDGEQGVGAGFEDGFDDGEDAALLFFGGDGRVFAGARGFAADVDDVGSLLEHAEGVGCGCSGIEEAAAVGEGIGRDVEDPHDECARAEREGARTQAPDELVARREGHAVVMLEQNQGHCVLRSFAEGCRSSVSRQLQVSGSRIASPVLLAFLRGRGNAINSAQR